MPDALRRVQLPFRVPDPPPTGGRGVRSQGGNPPEIQMRRTAHRGVATCLGIALLAMWGCSQSPTARVAAPDASSPPFLRVPAGSASAFSSGPGSGGGSAYIDGSRGGTVSNGRFQLHVPPGAFQGGATLTITVLDPSVMQCALSIS